MRFKCVHITLLLLCVVSLCGCSRRPDNVLSKQKMEDLMVDIHKAEAVIDMNGSRFENDSVRKTVKQSIFLKHGVTQEQFDTTLVWYGHHIKDYTELYEDIIARLEDEERELSGIKSSNARSGRSAVKRYPSAGDSADIWSKRRAWVISNEGNSDNVIKFDFTTQSDNKNGDRYQLVFELSNCPENKTEVFLAADYFDGTTSYMFRNAAYEGVNRYLLQGDSTKKVRRIFGYIKAHPETGNVCFIDSLILLRTRFDRQLYSTFGKQMWVGPASLNPEYRAKVNAAKRAALEAERAAAAEQEDMESTRRLVRRNYRVRPAEGAGVQPVETESSDSIGM